nr:folate hydrolase [Acidobacteriota bacterium]
GSYHSIYDSFTHFTRFIDPNFDYGLALSQTAGRTVLRLANADVLPLYFNNLSDTVEKYVREITKLADDMREETERKNQQISNHTLEMVADPTQVYVVPKTEEPVPFLNFAPLQNSLTRLRESARRYDAAMNEAASAGARTLSPEAEKSLDEALMKTERAMTREQGLPRRPWFKHQIYAPGFYTGYGVKTLPGVREAIEQRNWKEANDEVLIVAETLDGLSAEIDRATNILRGGRR